MPLAPSLARERVAHVDDDCPMAWAALSDVTFHGDPYS